MTTVGAPLAARLTIAPNPELLRLVRLTASTFATLGELGIDAVQEVRAGADELVSSLMESGAAADIDVDFEVTGTELAITASTVESAQPFEPDPMSTWVLAAITSRSSWSQADGRTIGTAAWDLPAAGRPCSPRPIRGRSGHEGWRPRNRG